MRLGSALVSQIRTSWFTEPLHQSTVIPEKLHHSYVETTFKAETDPKKIILNVSHFSYLDTLESITELFPEMP